MMAVLVAPKIRGKFNAGEISAGSARPSMTPLALEIEQFPLRVQISSQSCDNIWLRFNLVEVD
jgi:hypothetical protein